MMYELIEVMYALEQEDWDFGWPGTLHGHMKSANANTALGLQ